MCCDGQFCTTGYSKICLCCGKETRLVENIIPSYLQSHEKLRTVTTYSREYRFATLLKKTILHHNGPPVESPVWNHLFAEHTKKPFKSPSCIVSSLSKIDMKNKHYDSLTIFCVVFGLCTRPAITKAQYDYGLQIFREIRDRWQKNQEKRFFSYYWLLNNVLKLMGCSNLEPYTKKLKCPKRSKYYTTLLHNLGFKLPQIVESVRDSQSKRILPHILRA